MSKDTTTSRRSFLKSGAIIAAPLVVVAAPAMAAVADDGSKARLARIEDERAIETINRAFVRAFNSGGAKKARGLFASGKAPKFARGVTALALDSSAEPDLALSADGVRASARIACTAEFEHALEGEGTFVEMARLQGNGPVRISEAKTFVADYVKGAEGWAIERIQFA